MEIKVSEATPRQLDWLVAKIEGEEAGFNLFYNDPYEPECHYSTDPSYSWPIIDREKIATEYTSASRWRACVEWLDEPTYEGFGDTSLIAAMRCYVTMKLGDIVIVPIS